MRVICLLILFGLGVSVGYIYARKNPDYSSYWGYDKITRTEWHQLGWGTDPTEKPDENGCKKHIDGNGGMCSSYWQHGTQR